MTTTTVASFDEDEICDPGGQGVFLPFSQEEHKWNKEGRTVLYLALLLYTFMGVNVASDYFMTAIEFITMKKSRKRDKAGRLYTHVVWNDTVANLSLLALGSSAPEILLNCIETIVSNEFHSGVLGPSTIVGSAAFNLFIIIAVCVAAIDSDEVRRINGISVYHVTVVFSLFAYLWLLAIVAGISPNIVEWWEAGLTLLMFPMLVSVSFLADKGYMNFMALETVSAEDEQASGEERRTSKRPIVTDHGKHPRQLSVRRESRNSLFQTTHGGPLTVQGGRERSFSRLEDDGRIHTSLVPLDVSGKVPQAKKKKMSQLMPNLHNRLQHGSEQAKVEADRKPAPVKTQVNLGDLEDVEDENGNPIEAPNGIIMFEADAVACRVGVENYTLTAEVFRRNGYEGVISAKFHTARLNAVPGYDYKDVGEGTIEFKAHQTSKKIKLDILPKRIGETSDSFQLVLSEPTGGAIFNPMDDGGEDSAILTITIENDNENVPKTVGEKFWVLSEKILDWDNINIGLSAWKGQILDVFSVEVDDDDEDGEDGEKQEGHDNASEEKPEEEKPEKKPSVVDYASHVIQFPWKLSFALVSPPPNWAGGWLLFFLELGLIAVVTAMIADLAELFGCCCGLQPEATAITLVALGTSLPDTFASVTSAKQDEHADASIVNVTGSNSVNVFLGIGLPWTAAAFYWMNPGSALDEWKIRYPDMAADYPNGAFVVEAGTLGFSVLIFNCMAVIALTVIRLRRIIVGGELGGQREIKVGSSVTLVFCWVLYVSLSIWRLNSEDAQLALIPMVCLAAIVLVTGIIVGSIFKGRRHRESVHSLDVPGHPPVGRSGSGSHGDSVKVEPERAGRDALPKIVEAEDENPFRINAGSNRDDPPGLDVSDSKPAESSQGSKKPTGNEASKVRLNTDFINDAPEIVPEPVPEHAGLAPTALGAALEDDVAEVVRVTTSAGKKKKKKTSVDDSGLGDLLGDLLDDNPPQDVSRNTRTTKKKKSERAKSVSTLLDLE